MEQPGQLIKPHGSDALNALYVADDAERADLQKQAETLPKLLVCSQAATNAVMLASGYFNPLTGYMGLADSLAVAENMKTTGGLFWPVPVVNVVGDVSGIQGAKKTAELVPLCHPLRITSVEVAFTPTGPGELAVTATVRALDRTGVEMEALTAVHVACLTVYDMVKAVDRGVVVTDLRLLEKTGGKSGDWKREEP